MNENRVLRIINTTIANKLNPGDGYGMTEAEFEAWRELHESAADIAKSVLVALIDHGVLS